MDVRCVNEYKKMVVGQVYKAEISRSGQRINVIIDENTKYSFYRYKGRGHFKSKEDDVNYIEYLDR